MNSQRRSSALLLTCLLVTPLFILTNTREASGFSGTTGSLAWSFPVGSQLISMPSIYDVDGDNECEVIFGSGRLNRTFFCLYGTNGSEKWSFFTDHRMGSQVIYDVDNDGELEIILAGPNNSLTGSKVYCLNAVNGSVKWEISNSYNVYYYYPPAVGDVDNDGEPEIIIATRSQVALCLNALNGSTEWIFSTSYGYILGTPIIGDLDRDGENEIVLGCDDDYLYCLHGRNGTVIWSYTRGRSVRTSPIIVDVNGDNDLEVICADGSGYLYCLSGTNGTLIWEYEGVGGSPAVVDVDSDGQLELIISAGGLRCLWASNGTVKWIPPANYSTNTSPAIGDVDGDGEFEIIVGSSYGRVSCHSGKNGQLEW
ncbi:MAG: FG-GAP-like repeat-containing protein, partial [Candidatus Hodarchaeota archaeon]